ncbi:MAG: sporulation initiation factor Spo0A C-terminal domain-containing protein [Clostridia bacterium]
MTERTIEMLKTLDEAGYGIGDLKNLIIDIDSSMSTVSGGIEETTEKRISRILREIGMQPRILGYQYSKEAIRMLYENEATVEEGFIKTIYPKVAEKYNTTGTRVEARIRRAIENLFDRGDPCDIYKFFGRNSYYMKGKPTNSEFITTIVEYMRMEDL